MEFGDFSSLIVEYPDYNSLGNTLITLGEIIGPKTKTMDAQKS